jgi:ABC-2 type transport system permease protein
VCVTTGHGEASLDDDGPSGLSKVATLLEQNAYKAATVDLARGGDVPASCEVVWVAGPRVAFTPAETDALVRYEKAAGKVLVLASPLSEANVNPLLEPYGITFLGGVVADPDRSASVDPTDVVAEDFPTANPVMDGIPRLQLPVAGGFLTQPSNETPSGLTVSRLAVSSDAAWIESTPDAGFSRDAGDVPGPVVLAAAADDSRIEADAERRLGTGGGRPGIVRTRVVVTGSAECPTNQLLDRLGNRRLLVGSLSWLTQEEELLTVATRLPGARPLPWTAERQRETLFVTVGLVPGLVVLAGVASFVWRRRRTPSPAFRQT